MLRGGTRLLRWMALGVGAASLCLFWSPRTLGDAAVGELNALPSASQCTSAKTVSGAVEAASGAASGKIDSGASGSFEARLIAARSLLRAGDYARVETLARALLTEAESANGGSDSPGRIRNSIDAARAIDLLVAALVRAGKARAPETGDLARRAVAIKARALGSDDPEVAASVYGLAEQLRMAGAYPEARAAYERALAIREKDFAAAGAAAALVESLRGLGTFQYKVAEYAKARALYERALDVAETSLGPDHPDVALILVDMARVHRTTGDYVDGRELLDRALTIQERALGRDHLETAYTLRELGELLRLCGDYEGAGPAFARALAIRERVLGPDALEVADVLTGQGILLRRTGITRDHTCPEAYPVCLRAEAIAERVLGPDHPELTGYLEGLGWATFQCGPLNGTQQDTDRADEGEEPARRLLMQRTRGANRLFERALAIHEKAFGRDHLTCIDALEGLGWMGVLLGEWDRTMEAYRRKLAIEREAFGPDNVEVGFTLMQLAHAQTQWGVNCPEPPGECAVPAAAAFRSALDNALEAERISREHARLTGRSLAQSEALRFARWTAGLGLAIDLSVKVVDPEARRRTMDAVIRSRALVLDAMASRHRAILRADEPDVMLLARRMETARVRLANLAVRGSGSVEPEGHGDALDRARREAETAERALAARSARFAADLERASLGFDDVASSVPASSVLVAYSTYYSDSDLNRRSGHVDSSLGYVAFVLRAGEKVPAMIILGGEEIDRLVADWRHKVSSPPDGAADERSARDAGEKLRRKIWDPLVRYIGSARRVFIVPDGALNAVSFAALPVGARGYLVESGPTLHYLSAERDLERGTHAEAGRGLLAVGGPDYEATSLFASLGGKNASGASGGRGAAPSIETGASPVSHGSTPDIAPGVTAKDPWEAPALLDAAHPYRGSRSSCESFQSLRFAPLPEAGKEASRLASLWNEAQATGDGRDAARQLAGSEATEAAFKHLAPGKRFVHIATHGFFLGGDCASAFDGAGRDGSTTRGLAGENPLLLSGLALAGANHRAAAGRDEEDGILTAEEIASLDLSSVEWAVLSACNTASGDIRVGEGVLGLQRAFQIAGARTLVMSLWPVDDRATRHWMEQLYDGHLRRGLDTAEAVRSAMQSVLADRRRKGLDTHPFYWAGFIAAGDWR